MLNLLTTHCYCVSELYVKCFGFFILNKLVDHVCLYVLGKSIGRKEKLVIVNCY